MSNKFTKVSAPRQIGMWKENYAAPICLHIETNVYRSRGEENHVLGAREDSSILRYFLQVTKPNFRSLVSNSSILVI